MAKRRIAEAGGASESDTARSLSKKDLAKVQAALKDSGKLPDGYSLQTQIAEAKITATPLDPDDNASREKVQVAGTNTIIVRDGVDTPDEVWDPGTEIMVALTNNFDFFPDTFRPDEDTNRASRL